MSLDSMPRGILVCSPLYFQEGRTIFYLRLNIRIHLQLRLFCKRIASTLTCHLAKVLIVTIQEDSLTSVCQIIIEFTFCSLYAIKRSKAFKMSTSHICYKSIVCLNHSAQELYLPRMICPSFNNGNLVFWTYSKQRAWHSDMIIQIPLRKQNLITLAQYCADQLFGCCLSICSCYLKNRNTKFLTMIRSQTLQCLQDIINQDVSFITLRSVLSLIDHGISTACIQSRRGKSIAIKSCPL